MGGLTGGDSGGSVRLQLSKQDVRALIYQEILEYHPSAKEDFQNKGAAPNFMYPR